MKINEFIEKNLKEAIYEYDESVKSWVAWIVSMPGVYGQGKTVEETREELTEILEEYLLVSLKEGKSIPGFTFPKNHFSKKDFNVKTP
jgi:predicted RNase H-like HicB family nuclease